MKRALVALGRGGEALGRSAVVAPGGRPGSGAPQRSGGERSEPERSEGAPEPRDLSPGDAAPADPEVPSTPARRRLSAAFKLRILAEADACTERGQLGALLRREGLYSSHLISWRRQREQGVLDALTPRKRGRKARPVDPQARRVAELERENRRLQKRLEKADMIIDFQKKVAALLGIPLNRPDDAEND
jgi:transposase